MLATPCHTSTVTGKQYFPDASQSYGTTTFRKTTHKTKEPPVSTTELETGGGPTKLEHAISLLVQGSMRKFIITSEWM